MTTTLRIDLPRYGSTPGTVEYTDAEMIEVFTEEQRAALANGDSVTMSTGSIWTDLNAYFDTRQSRPHGFIAVATYGPDDDVTPMWGWGLTTELAEADLHINIDAATCEDFVGEERQYALDLWIDEYVVPMFPTGES